MLFTHKEFRDHEQIIFCRDADSGLRAIIAIHDGTLGPVAGGVRMWPYASEEEALTDVLRLSVGMTLKSAIIGLPLGGGKAVILGNPAPSARAAVMTAFAAFVESLNGRYWGAKDVGITVDDITLMAKHTRFIAGLQPVDGSIDPSLITALGVLSGIRAALRCHRGSDQLEGLKVAIQGLGHVGWALGDLLHQAGARLVVADLSGEILAQAQDLWDAEVVAVNAIHRVPADVFAPCALGAVLHPASIPQLGARIVAGGANNQLLSASCAELLQEAGVLYAPDFVINGGGILMVAADIIPGLDEDTIRARALGIGDRLQAIFEEAKATGLTTYAVAVKQASGIVAEARRSGHAA